MGTCLNNKCIALAPYDYITRMKTATYTEPTFLWHDYETSGAYPLLDRPVQFAALRTNAALEIIGDPLDWYCQPAVDVLPHPVASLITGVTPQDARSKGLIEAEFAANILSMQK